VAEKIAYPHRLSGQPDTLLPIVYQGGMAALVLSGLTVATMVAIRGHCIVAPLVGGFIEMSWRRVGPVT
jgi:hypothetical protein